MDASIRKEVKQLNLGGGAASILVAPDGSRAYVAISTSDKIAVADLKTLEAVGQISGETACRTPAEIETDPILTDG